MATTSLAPVTSIAEAWQRARSRASTSVGTLREFVTRTDRRYVWYRHCAELAEALQRIADGTLTRLMVFMPPRHGKTQLVSRRFPAYYLRRNPEKWVGLASYEATLAHDLSRSCRDAFVMDGGDIRDDSKAVNLWQTPEGGGMWAAGVGGPLTGKGGHLLLIDDPIKNDEEANSETIREKHKSWYDATFSTRLEPGGSVVVVQTRWNQDDLSGYLLAKESLEPEGWTVLNLPAFAEEMQAFPETCEVIPDWREYGEPLCPERYDAAALQKIKGRIGSYFWSALYQQRPTPVEGGIFKRNWWQYYATLELAQHDDRVEYDAILPQSFDFVCMSWDMAFKETDTSDYVVGQVWGVKAPNFYLLDQTRGRMDFPTTVQAFRQLNAKWPEVSARFVEDAANGAAVIATLRRTVGGIIPVKPQGGKESRAAGAAPLVEAQNVFLPCPELAPWVRDFVEECAGFPNMAHDDQVDAMTQALARIGPMTRLQEHRPLPIAGKVEDKAREYDFQNRRFKSEPKFTDEMDGQVRGRSHTRPMTMPRVRTR